MIAFSDKMDLIILAMTVLVIIIILFILGKIFSFLIKVAVSVLILFIALSLVFTLFVYLDATSFESHFMNSTNLFIYTNDQNLSSGLSNLKPMLAFSIRPDTKIPMQTLMQKNNSAFHLFSENELANKSVKDLIDSSNGKYFKTFVISNEFFKESKENITIFSNLKINTSEAIYIMNGNPIDGLANESDSSKVELEIYALGGIHNARTLLFSSESITAMKNKGFSNLILDIEKNNLLIEPESAMIFLIKNIPPYLSKRLILLNASGQ